MHDLEPSSEGIIMNASMESSEMTKTGNSYKEKHFRKLAH